MSSGLSAPAIAARIMAQADANGPCGPKRGAIHASEYFTVYSDALSSHVLRTGRFPEQRGALLLLGTNGPVMLFPAVDVPVGAIRWEPSE